MNWKIQICLLILTCLMTSIIAGCATPGGSASSAGQNIARPEVWAKKTHSNDVEPNFKMVFPQDKVNQIKITITPEDWSAMRDNITKIYGRGGARGAQGGWGGGFEEQGDIPAYFPATIEFNGLTWTHVGIRYKGNWGLRSTWNNPSLKTPYKLDFDQYEDQFPEITDQRFYGFKQLSLSNSFNDSTYMRDAVVDDIYAKAGLMAPETAYYQITLDNGEAHDLGLYIVIEYIDDTVIKRYRGDDTGNIYKGRGPAISLAEGTFDGIRGSYINESNNLTADWSDIEALYNVLHSPERISDPEKWRKSLESVLDVDIFLEWMAVSAVIQHWDTYGSMDQNFFLYHNPDTDLIEWITWDHNEDLKINARGGMPGGRMSKNITMGREEFKENWPLIRFLLDDPVYYEALCRLRGRNNSQCI